MNRILIVEDDFASRTVLLRLLRDYGDCDIAVDGIEAVEACRVAIERKEPYDLLCLDIHMPRMDGQVALAAIRAIEEEKGIAPGNGAKVVMTTAVDDASSIMEAFRNQCEGYIVKPIVPQKFHDVLADLGFVPGG